MNRRVARSLRCLQGAGVSSVTSSAGPYLYPFVVPTGLKRYYGGGDLHFITCSCYHRDEDAGKKTSSVSAVSTRPLQKTARSGPPSEQLGRCFEYACSMQLRATRRLLIPSPLPQCSGKDQAPFDRLSRKAGGSYLRLWWRTRIHRLNGGGEYLNSRQMLFAIAAGFTC